MYSLVNSSLNQSHNWLDKHSSRFILILIGIHTNVRNVFNTSTHIVNKPSASPSVSMVNKPLSAASTPP